MNVIIPFSQDMAQQTLAGRKTCTSRTKRYGKPGDTFTLIEAGRQSEYMLWDIRRYHLQIVAERLYRREGFDTSDAFIAKWKTLHPAAGYQPDQVVYVHYYQEIKRGGQPHAWPLGVAGQP